MTSPMSKAAYDIRKIREIAAKELGDELFRSAVEMEKDRLRKQKWWHRLLPFTITVTIKRR